MVTASIVIGANYGDEGKGQTVHELSDRNTCVVRFNGGAQAGHTVEHHGRRNVFHQHGAGTFVGAATYLGPEVIVSPSMYIQENNKFPQATMCVDRRARVTTFTDIVINQLVERERSSGRHGSCGMGINETVVRHGQCPLIVDDIGQSDLEDRVMHIWKVYGPARLAELGYERLVDDYFAELPERVARISAFEMRFMYDTVVKVKDINDIALMFKNLVFEGAQGLLLSERNMQWFPHLTRSDTGVTNARKILEELEDDSVLESVNVVYVTRPYLTRHGAGPLEHEWSECPYNVYDPTNVPNEWQGTIRYAPLNLDLLREHVQGDFYRYNKPANGILLVSCMDHVEDRIHYIDGGELWFSHPDSMIAALRDQFGNMTVKTRR